MPLKNRAVENCAVEFLKIIYNLLVSLKSQSISICTVEFKHSNIGEKNLIAVPKYFVGSNHNVQD